MKENKREDEKWIIIKCEKWEKYDSIIYFILYCIILNILKNMNYTVHYNVEEFWVK